MSRQIYFFHSECDSIRFLQEIERHNGVVLAGDTVVPPLSVEDTMLNKMNTHSCKFSIVPRKPSFANCGRIIDGMAIEFNNCCKGNSLSRTYEIGRIYLTQTHDGDYIPEMVELYELLRKYIKTTYHFEKKAGAYFAPEFWERYCAHYYHATCAGRPISIPQEIVQL